MGTSMLRGFGLTIHAELARAFIIMRRYWFATVIAMAMGYGTLIGIVYGLIFASQSEMVTDMAARAINGILGFLIGVFAFGIVGMFTQGLQGMARTGELEQVCLSPFGLVINFFARSFVSALNSIFSSTVMLVLVAVTVGRGSLQVAPVETALLLILTYINLIGFGFMVGGLVLVFKQVGQIAMIIRFGMLGLAIFAEQVLRPGVPWVLRAVAHALPITDAAVCLKYVLIQGQERMVTRGSGRLASILVDENMEPVMRHMPVYFHESFFFLLVSCVVWTLVGISVFRFLENWSRDKGTLGAY
jgi:hypothetical protein